MAVPPFERSVSVGRSDDEAPPSDTRTRCHLSLRPPYPKPGLASPRVAVDDVVASVRTRSTPEEPEHCRAHEARSCTVHGAARCFAPIPNMESTTYRVTCPKGDRWETTDIEGSSDVRAPTDSRLSRAPPPPRSALASTIRSFRPPTGSARASSRSDRLPAGRSTDEPRASSGSSPVDRRTFPEQPENDRAHEPCPCPVDGRFDHEDRLDRHRS